MESKIIYLMQSCVWLLEGGADAGLFTRSNLSNARDHANVTETTRSANIKYYCIKITSTANSVYFTGTMRGSKGSKGHYRDDTFDILISRQLTVQYAYRNRWKV